MRRITSTSAAHLTALLTALTLTACGQDADDDGTAPVTSAIAADRQLGDLLLDEKQQLCRDVLPALESVAAWARVCEFKASIDADTPEACEAMTADCIAEREGDPAGFSCEDVEEDALECEATVGQYLDCVRSVVAQADAHFAPFTCARAADWDAQSAAEQLDDGVGGFDNTPECALIDASCGSSEAEGDGVEG